MALTHFNLTIEDGIILHLINYFSFYNEFEVPIEITQPGIAEAVGIRRSHVSYAIKGLKEKEYVIERIAHIKNIIRKRKVYFLTSNGINYAKKIRKNIEQKTVQLKNKSGEIKKLKINEINKYLSVQIPILQILRLTSQDGILESDNIEKHKPWESKSIDNMPGKTMPVKFIDSMTQPIRFIGRKNEQKKIKKWIKSEIPRLIIIKGIPGIGKTTLAAKIIDDYANEPKQNLFWYRIHEWDTLRSMLNDLAVFFNKIGRQQLKFYLEHQSTVELAELRNILERDLEGEEIILVFDDFQKVDEKLKQVFSIFVELLELKRLKNVNIIVITRGVTGFYDRRKVVINKLIGELELDGLDSNDSWKLLNSKDIKEADFDRIYEISEGHPLTLELIGIHINEKSLTNETNHFFSKFDIGELFKAQHDITKYIHEEIFQSLSKTERKLLSMISVFRYPILPETFFITDEIDYETIDYLIMKSLIHETTSGYDQHELIKEFFYRRLTPLQKLKCHTLAANFYSSELEQSKTRKGNDLSEITNSILEAQYHNLKAGNYNNTAKLAIEYGDILISKGFTEEFIDILRQLSSEIVSADIWPELLIHKGHILTLNGEWDNALGCYLDSLKWCEGYKINCGLARAHNAIGGIHYRKGDLKKAMKHYKQGLKFAQSEGDENNRAKLYSNIALIHWENKNFEQAIDLIKKSQELSRDLEDKQGIARTHNNLGIIYWGQNKLDDAITEYNKSLELSEEIGDKHTIAILFDNLGEVYRINDDKEKAHEYYQKSLELSEELGFKWQIAEVNCNLGLLFSDSDNTKSKIYLDSALEMYQDLGAKREVEKVKKILEKNSK